MNQFVSCLVCSVVGKNCIVYCFFCNDIARKGEKHIEHRRTSVYYNDWANLWKSQGDWIKGAAAFVVMG